MFSVISGPLLPHPKVFRISFSRRVITGILCSFLLNAREKSDTFYGFTLPQNLIYHSDCSLALPYPVYELTHFYGATRLLYCQAILLVLKTLMGWCNLSVHVVFSDVLYKW